MSENWKINVKNLAVASYSPIIYKNKIKHYISSGLNAEHVIVFLDISDIDDENNYPLNWRRYNLILIDSIDSVLGRKPSVSTDGGTSDGRFMAKICNEVIEFGLINKSIHKINECVKEDDLMTLVEIYKNILSVSRRFKWY